MPTYTYTPNTPNSEDPMNVTQPLILENFQAIPELIAVNHVGFNVDSFGTHNVLALQAQSAPTTTTTEIDLFYSSTASPAGLYIVYPQGASTTTPVQISVPYNPTATGTAYTGYVSFPSGIKLSYGTYVGSGQYGYITLPQYKTVVYPMNATPITVNSGWLQASGLSSNGTDQLVTVKYSSGSTTYNYFAIGM